MSINLFFPVVDSMSFKANSPEPPSTPILPNTRNILQKIISSTFLIIVFNQSDNELISFRINPSSTFPYIVEIISLFLLIIIEVGIPDHVT